MHLHTQRTCILSQGRLRQLPGAVCPALRSLRGALRSQLSGLGRSRARDVAQAAASQRAGDGSEVATVATASVLQDTAFTPSAAAWAVVEAGPWGDSSCCCEAEPGHALAHSPVQHTQQHTGPSRHSDTDHPLSHLHHPTNHHHDEHHHQQHHHYHHLRPALQLQGVHSLAAAEEAHLLHASTSAPSASHTIPDTTGGAHRVTGVSSSTNGNGQGHGHEQPLGHAASASSSSGSGLEVLEVYRSGATAPLVLGLGNGAAAGAGAGSSAGAGAAFTLPPRAAPASAPDTGRPRPAAAWSSAAATTAVAAAATVPAPGVLSPLAPPGSSSTDSLSSMDSDGEMCMLVPDPEGGDIQMVCDSDPAHPISLAEEAVLHPLVPSSLLQDIEHKLEADLSTIAVTIVFAVGFICLEFGVNDLIEIFFGHSVISDLTCIGIGLVVVFGVKVSKQPLLRLDRWN